MLVLPSTQTCGGSGTVGRAVGRSKINKKQSFAKTAGRMGIPGECIAKGPGSAAAHKNGPRHTRYSHISPPTRRSDLSTPILMRCSYTSFHVALLEPSSRVSDQSDKPGVHGLES